MARMTTKVEELDRLHFAEAAAAAFLRDSTIATFGTVKAGEYLALRWGMGNDCVLVVKLDEYDEPVNYQQLIKKG